MYIPSHTQSRGHVYTQSYTVERACIYPVIHSREGMYIPSHAQSRGRVCAPDACPLTGPDGDTGSRGHVYACPLTGPDGDTESRGHVYACPLTGPDGDTQSRGHVCGPVHHAPSHPLTAPYTALPRAPLMAPYDARASLMAPYVTLPPLP
jgi:hypothetical protein